MLQHNFIKQEVQTNSISDLKVDASFRKIAKNVICFHIWKIDEDRLEAELKGSYGTFLDDAAYIIYAASPVGSYVNQDTITREIKPGTILERFIHFWLGERVSEQKRSNVAHKIQELDTYFGNVATEYRETQDNESARFLSYFKRGMNIKCGTLINSSDPNRLYQLRGRKWLRCIEMESIGWEHFNSDYVMLLKTELYLFVWVGRSSSNIERRDAIELASKMQPKSAGLTIVDDGYEQSLSDACKRIWNSLLPLSQRVVSQISLATERKSINKVKVYKCAYRSNRLHLDQLDIALPTRNDLNDSTSVYVIDGFSQGVWLWVGLHAPHQENLSAMGNGRAFVKKKKYPYSTPVIRVVEGHEPIEFTRLFSNWNGEWNESPISLKPISTILGKFDSLTLCQRPKMAASTQLIDDGRGERIIFCITQDQMREVPASKLVTFTTSNCYVMRYTVTFPLSNPADSQNMGIQTIIYQWNGVEACAEVIVKAERFARASFENTQEKAMLVQMCEGDETPHFLQIFEGKLIIMQSDKCVLTNNVNNISNNNSSMNKSSDQFVLKIYGDASYNSKAIEVQPLNTMNPKECYVIKTNHVWVWCGQCSTGDEREVAKNVGALLGESSLVLEGKEPREFWRSVTAQMSSTLVKGGNIPTNSSNGSSLSNSANNTNGTSNGCNSPLNGVGVNNSNGVSKARMQTQLFMVWLQRGTLHNLEIVGYEQTDLSPECIYILDAGFITYVWVGEHISPNEGENYLKMVQYYLEAIVPISRRPTTAVAAVRQGHEPNVFRGFFEQWNYSFWVNYIPYTQKRQQLMAHTDLLSNGNNKKNSNAENCGTPLPPVLLNHKKNFDKHHKYPLTTLQYEADLLPAEVNPLKREVHLTHDDFVSVFNMSFWEFDELPGWKKQELKKKHKLF